VTTPSPNPSAGRERRSGALRTNGNRHLPYRPLGGAFREFWENFYTWWLLWTYNPPSVRHLNIFNLERNEFWMTREKFLARFGKA
jgi:hypothetical protein